jgi:hypothetical protein
MSEKTVGHVISIRMKISRLRQRLIDSITSLHMATWNGKDAAMRLLVGGCKADLNRKAKYDQIALPAELASRF